MIDPDKLPPLPPLPVIQEESFWSDKVTQIALAIVAAVSTIGLAIVSALTLFSKNVTPLSTKTKGIVNLGSTCYMNSVIQTVIASKSLKEKIMASKWQGIESKRLNPQETAAAENLKEKTQDFIRQLEQSRNPYCLEKAAEELRAAIFEAGVYGVEDIDRQQDAAQLLEFYLDLLGAQVPFEITKTAPGDRVVESEPLGLIQVPINGEKGKPKYVQNLLDELFTEKEVNGEFRDHSRYQETCRLRNDPPEQLFLHFKRFTLNEKIQDKLLLPANHTLDLSKGYGGKQANYRVTGAIHHRGCQLSGHYKACMREDGKWITANDRFVSESENIDNLLAESYILVLERA